MSARYSKRKSTNLLESMYQNSLSSRARLFAVLSSVLVLVSCAGVQFADQADDAQAKQFQVAAGKSNIYVYRNQDVGINTSISVSVNEAHVGNTDKGTFILETVSPGNHTIKAEGENVDELQIVTTAGRNYFVWLEVRLGVVTNRAHLQLVDESQGKTGVRESRLVY